jgi:biotin operon repressor
LAFEMPPPIKGPAPRLDTINEIEVIIRKATAAAETPISLNEIKRRMKAKAVRHSTVRAAVDHLKRMGCLVEAPKGRGYEWGILTDLSLLEGSVRVR